MSVYIHNPKKPVEYLKIQPKHPQGTPKGPSQCTNNTQEACCEHPKSKNHHFVRILGRDLESQALPEDLLEPLWGA